MLHHLPHGLSDRGVIGSLWDSSDARPEKFHPADNFVCEQFFCV
jgi:hypothetical protein